MISLFSAIIPPAVISPSVPRPPLCFLPPDQGDGIDAFGIRFYYSPRFRECKIFRYTGSGGNANNFEDKETCEKMCECKGM